MKELNIIKSSLQGLKGCFVAGGALTSVFTRSKIKDYDIYPKSEDDMYAAVNWCFDNGLWCVHLSERAVTFSDNKDTSFYDEDATIIQIVTFGEFKKAKDIFKKFDFTINMAAIDLDDGKLYTHKNFLKHNSQRYLKFNTGTDFPYSSVIRLNKYKERGYTIGFADQFSMLMACQNKPINSWQDLKSQVGGFYGESIEIRTDHEFTFDRAIKALHSATPSFSKCNNFDKNGSYLVINEKTFKGWYKGDLKNYYGSSYSLDLGLEEFI